MSSSSTFPQTISSYSSHSSHSSHSPHSSHSQINAFHFCNPSLPSNSNNSSKPTRISLSQNFPLYTPITPSPLNPPLKLEKYYLISDIKHDVRIHVGERPNTITFKAHSNMLKSRSKYFKIALSDDWMRKKDGWIILNLPNISPEVFNFILNYFYTGRLTFDDAPIDGKSCLKRIIAADELCLDQLLAHEQSFLITHRSEWIRQNFLTVYKLTITLPALESLKNYCMILLYQEPKLLMNDIHYLDESTLLMMLKNENLQLDEIEIWENLIRWGVSQIPMLKYRKPRDWTKDEWDQLSNTIAMFLQFIRFEHISKDDFLNRNNEIYSRLLPSEFKTKFQEIEYSDNTEYIYKTINNKHNKDNSSGSSTFVNRESEDIYHSKENSSSSTIHVRQIDISYTSYPILPYTKRTQFIDSKIINISHIGQISNWIKGNPSASSRNSVFLNNSNIYSFGNNSNNNNNNNNSNNNSNSSSLFINTQPTSPNSKYHYYTSSLIPFRFTLILRGSKDGFSTDIFHKWCDSYGSPTLIIIKLKNSNEIIGGYNHFNWKSPWLFPTTQHDKYAFIFSLCDKDGNREQAKVVRPKRNYNLMNVDDNDYEESEERTKNNKNKKGRKIRIRLNSFGSFGNFVRNGGNNNNNNNDNNDNNNNNNNNDNNNNNNNDNRTSAITIDNSNLSSITKNIKEGKSKKRGRKRSISPGHYQFGMNALRFSKYSGPWFGKSDLQIQNNRICSCKPHDYDGSITAESGSFEIEDYEVFGVGFA